MTNEWRDLPTMADVASAQAVEEEMTTREQYEEWFIKTFDSRPFPPASAPAFDFCWAGFQAGAASRNEELQRLQMALAEAEALELGTAEKCDQLRANIISLIGSLIRAANYIDVLGGTSGEYRNAVMLTPKQSITEYRNKVIEECAAVLNVAITRLSSCGASIKNDVAISTLKEQSCRLRAMKEPE